MNALRERYYRALFLASAIYDLVLGIIFTFFCQRAFGWLGIENQLPPFAGYLTLAGAFVFVSGVAYFLISLGDFRQNCDLILVGALYKLAYAAVAFYYFFAGGLPHIIFVALFGVLDCIFFILMSECWIFVTPRRFELGRKQAV